MRRVFGIVLLVLGVVLIVGGALVRWVAAPALVKAPLDIDRTTIAEGRSQVFVLTTQSVADVPVIATRAVRGDRDAGLADHGAGGGGPAHRGRLPGRTGAGLPSRPRGWAQATGADRDGCLPATDPGFIQKTSDRIAFDRVKGVAVADGTKFKASVNGDTSVQHVGLGYTFPIDTKKTTYPFFDTVLNKPFPMQYQSTEKLEGLSLYKFVQQVPTSPIKINGILPGSYSNVRIVWVEPTTGIIVKGSEQIAEKFITGGGTAFSGTLVFNDATVKSQADFAKDQRRQVQVIRVWAPLVIAVLGLVLVVVGVLLLLRRRNGSATAAVDNAPLGQDADVDRGAGQDRAAQR